MEKYTGKRILRGSFDFGRESFGLREAGGLLPREKPEL
jgi:hypothetical protein